MADLLANQDEYTFFRFKNGDENAFEIIFKANYSQIVGFCEQFAGDNDQAQSLAQEAFIKLWLDRGKIMSVNGVRSFLYTSAKTGCLNYIRHKKVASRYRDNQLQEKENQLNSEVLESFDFDLLEFSELENLINKVVDELPEKCRMVFIKSRYEGKKDKEIAEEMGISIKSVEADKTRALKILKSKLSEYLPAVLVQLIMNYL